ncbi:MAG: hypothetical protein ACOZF0_00425 [Thermodesulfobacteriota bacterium]
MKRTLVVLFSVLLGILCAGSTQAMEFDEMGGVDIHGFISQGYLKSDENNFFADTEKGTTQFNEAAINFSTDVTEKLRIGLQLFARDLGNIGNNDVILDWAVADYRWRDWLGLRIGNLKFVNGLYNETRDVDMLRTSIFLPQSVYNESWRESTALIQGAGLYGELPLKAAGSFSYSGQYGTVSMPKDGGAAKLAEDQWPLKSRDITPLLERSAAAAGTTITGLNTALNNTLTALDANNLLSDYDTAVARDQVNKLSGAARDPIIDIMTVDVEDIDVDYAYTGQGMWNTPLEGMVVGVTAWGYYFEAVTQAKLDTQAMQTISTMNGSTKLGAIGAGLQQGQLPTQQNLDSMMADFNSAKSSDSMNQLGVGLPSYPVTFGAESKSLTYSAEYTFRNLVLAGEYMETRYKLNFKSDLFANPAVAGMLAGLADPRSATFSGDTMTINTFTAAGWYGSATYRFTYWFELGAYYSEYYPDVDDKEGYKRRDVKKLDSELHRGYLKDTCMTLRFDINENWVLKLEGHVMRGAASLLGADNPAPTDAYPLDGSERYDSNWLLGAAKITYSF